MQALNNFLPNPTLLFLSFLAFPSGSLPAQTEADKPTPVRFRITRFDPSDQPSPEFFVFDEKAQIPVEVPGNYIAGPYKALLRDHLYLDLFKQDAETPSISVKIPQGQHEDLLLIFVPKKGTDDYAVMPIHVPLTKIKGGARFIVNVSKTEVAIKYGDADPVVIPSPGTGLVPGPGGNQIVSLPAVVIEKTAEGWRPFSTEHWPYDPRARKFLFIYRSERTNHLTFHGVSDRVDLQPSDAP